MGKFNENTEVAWALTASEAAFVPLLKDILTPHLLMLFYFISGHFVLFYFWLQPKSILSDTKESQV